MPWFSSGTSQILTAIGQLHSQLATGLAGVNATLKGIVMSQANLEQAVQTLNTAFDAIQTDAQAIETGLAGIADKISKGQAAQIDLTSVNALVTRAQSIQTAVDTAATDTTAEAAPPAPPA